MVVEEEDVIEAGVTKRGRCFLYLDNRRRDACSRIKMVLNKLLLLLLLLLGLLAVLV